MPQSNEPPAATVFTALRADDPEGTGSFPPEDNVPLAVLADAEGVALDEAALEGTVELEGATLDTGSAVYTTLEDWAAADETG